MPPSYSLAAAAGLAFLIGIVAGMRSILPLAVLSVAIWSHPAIVPPAAPVQWLALYPVVLLLVLLAIGELVVDKLPRTPNRTALAPFLFRLATGGLGGAVVAQVARNPGWAGAMAGVIGGGISAIAMFHARRRAGRALGVRDPYVGAAEDVLAIALAIAAAAALTGTRRSAGRPTPDELRERLARRTPVRPAEPIATAVRAERGSL